MKEVEFAHPIEANKGEHQAKEAIELLSF